MKTHLPAIALLSLVLAAAGAFGCDDDADKSVIRREGEPDYVRAEDEEVMARAIAKAQETHAQFAQALANPKAQHRGFAVKKPFPTPDGGQEHMWINEVTWNGQAFQGVVNNEPVDTTAVKLGDRVTVRPDELSDWMYFEGNRVVGGYTLRVLHYQRSSEEQRAFVEQTGLEIPPVDF